MHTHKVTHNIVCSICATYDLLNMRQMVPSDCGKIFFFPDLTGVNLLPIQYLSFRLKITGGNVTDNCCWWFDKKKVQYQKLKLLHPTSIDVCEISRMNTLRRPLKIGLRVCNQARRICQWQYEFTTSPQQRVCCMFEQTWPNASLHSSQQQNKISATVLCTEDQFTETYQPDFSGRTGM